MRPDPHRRIVLSMSAGAALAAAGARAAASPFSVIEARVGGRLGVHAVELASGRRLAWRSRERFAMCSVFKWLLAAAVLARVDAGLDRLDRRIAYCRTDLVGFSPVTSERLAEGALSVEVLCEAAVTRSDNAAANLLLASLGGPAGLTAWLRVIGDPTTRLDRNEPDLNSAAVGDFRDTTTPEAMTADLQRILLGGVLKPASRQRLVDWMVANRTGDARLRAGLPRSWRVGDKTGTGASEVGTSNDVAITWPDRGGPIVIAAFLTRAVSDDAARDRAIAEVGRIVTEGFA